MVKTCENCGAELKEGVKFCHECGKKVPTSKKEKSFCPNCGAMLKNSEFCEDCGRSLNSLLAPKNESFIGKYKILIIIGIIFIIFAVFLGDVLLLMDDNAFDDMGIQTVEVGETEFIIPQDFNIVPLSIDFDYEYSTPTFSKEWSNGFDEVYISTMELQYDVDVREVLENQGVEKNMMGYDGYYIEDDGVYGFAFKTEGYICLVLTTSPDVLDEITCLG